MKLLMMILIGVAIAGGLYYFTLSEQGGAQKQAMDAANSAQDAADAYRKNQADMMKQLGQ